MSEVDEFGNPIVPEENPPVSAEPTPSDDVEKLKAEVAKAKEVAENYKKEAEKLRQPSKRSLGDKVESQGAPDHIRNDFMSKREDVYDELKEEFSKLGEDEWGKFRSLVAPAVNEVLDRASSERRFAAKGEIQRAVKEVMEFVKSRATHRSEIEEARAEGAREMGKMEQAEISGVKVRPSEGVAEEVRRLAEEKGWSAEEAKEILDKRKQREQDYAVR